MNALTLSLTLFAAAIGPPLDDSQRESTGVHKFLTKWANEWRTGEVDRMLALYSDSDTVAAIESRGILRKGRREIRKMYEDAFGELIFEKVELEPEVLTEAGDFAWATGRYKSTVRTRADKRRYILEVRGSFVLERGQDEWRIVLEHFSPLHGVPRAREAE